MIKNFATYIREAYDIDETDSTEIARHKIEVNNMTRWITEYNQKKSILFGIYMSFTDDEDLLNKLRQQKLVDSFETDSKIPSKVRNTNISDPKRMKFENPLLSELANVAEKQRMLKDLEEDLKEQEKTINDREAATVGNERLRPSFQKDIERMKSKMSDIENDINEIKREINILNTKAKEKFTQMQRDLSQKNKLLADDINDRRQNTKS
jgi:hypothetical protein